MPVPHAPVPRPQATRISTAPMLELRHLAPEPTEAWQRLLRLVSWGAADQQAAARSIEALFRRGPDLVADTYAYLARVPETAAILGWEDHVDPAFLEERRRFFTVWLARTLGLDTGDEFARYLFRAGIFHAGHGPRRIHVPPEYVTAAVGLLLASFARSLADASLAADTLAGAMAAWSKFLNVQLALMLQGYHAARALQTGDVFVPCTLYGGLRPLLQTHEVVVGAAAEGSVGDVLRKFFDYYPQVRSEALERVWDTEDSQASLWQDVVPVYMPRAGWRVLLNGRDVAYDGGFETRVGAGDALALFPPGR